MKRSNRWLWAGIMLVSMMLLAAGCSTQGASGGGPPVDDTWSIELSISRGDGFGEDANTAISIGDTVTIAAIVENTTVLASTMPAQNGTIVSFEACSGLLSPKTTTTSNGLACTTYTATALGVDTITAVVGNVLATINIFVSKELTPEPGVPASVEIFKNQQEDSLLLRVLVKDVNLSPVTDGTLVDFQTCAGMVVPNPAPTSEGLACATYYNTTGVTGDDTIVIVSGGVLASTTITYTSTEPGEPASITLYPSASTLPMFSSIFISAVVEDSNGGPVPDGTAVSFYSSFGTMSPAVAGTRAGLATSSFRPSGQISVYPATATIIVAAGNITTDPLSITVTEWEGALWPHVLPRSVIAGDAITGPADSGNQAVAFLTLGGTVIGSLDTVAFHDVDPDTITRSDAGGSFIAAGIAAGEYIGVEGSTANDGAYEVAAVEPAALTLGEAESLNDEPAGAPVTIMAKPLIMAGDAVSGSANSKIYLGVLCSGGKNIRISTTMGTLTVVDSSLAVSGNGTAELIAAPDEKSQVVEFLLTTPDYAGIATVLAEDVVNEAVKDILKVAVF